jgi:beta-phosphoglucomutase family hydrolase
MGTATVSADRYAAVVFDLDGVLTDTATAHRASWRSVFDQLLATPGPGRRDPFTDEDYLRYVDGRRRYDGAATFLASRGISLPWGDPADPPGAPTVCGVGNRKDEVFGQWLTSHHVPAYPDATRFLARLAVAGIRRAVVSASRNCAAVLASAGLSDAFEVQVDGVVADELGLPGKPDPATFLEAARRLGVPAARCVVVEDAESGVRAGRSGGFGLVVGIDRAGGAQGATHAAALRAAGADVVVGDLDELAVTAHDAPVGRGAETG